MTALSREAPRLTRQVDRPRLEKSAIPALNGQVELLKAYFRRNPGVWLTPEEASRVCGAAASAVTSRLRDLRKAQYGGWTLDLRPRKGRLNEYTASPPGETPQLELL